MDAIIERDYKKLRYLCNVKQPKLDLMVETINYTNNMKALNIIEAEKRDDYELVLAVFRYGNVRVIKYYYTKYVIYNKYNRFQSVIDKCIRILCCRGIVYLKHILPNSNIDEILRHWYNYIAQASPAAAILYTNDLHVSNLMRMKSIGLDMSKLPIYKKDEYLCAMGLIEVDNLQLDEYHKAAIIIQKWWRNAYS